MKISLCAVIFFITGVLFAQQKSKEEILNILAKETCECINEKIDLSTNNQSYLEVNLGLCILGSINANYQDIQATYNTSDKSAFMDAVAQEVGLKMAFACPDFFSAFVVDEDNTANTMEGTVTEIKKEQFVSLSIKDASGRNYSFILLNYFQGADLLIDNRIKKKDYISIDYTEEEFYDSKLKDFRYYKVIRALEKK